MFGCLGLGTFLNQPPQFRIPNQTFNISYFDIFYYILEYYLLDLKIILILYTIEYHYQLLLPTMFKRLTFYCFSRRKDSISPNPKKGRQIYEFCGGTWSFFITEGLGVGLVLSSICKSQPRKRIIIRLISKICMFFVLVLKI